jgi:biotin carboxyl carrier protein
MERPIIAIVAALALASAASALAQSSRDREPPPSLTPDAQQPDAQSLSDNDLEKFADIYVELEHTADKFQSQLSAAKTDAEAQDVQSRMQQESTAVVSKRGWTPERFVAVGDAINADQTLAEKTLKLIADRR